MPSNVVRSADHSERGGPTCGSPSVVELPLHGGIDLDSTLYMGQTFAWDRNGDWHVGVVDGVLMQAREVDGALLVRGSDSADRLRALACRYFDAERDLPALQSALSEDAHVAEAIRRYPGLRVLRLPFWECLASFILSTVNNVGRITGIVRTLSRRLGDRIVLNGVEAYTFPQPGRLIDLPLATLYDCGSGFRARGLQDAARALSSGSVSETSLRALSTDDARVELMKLRGVGPKVADCVLLYSLDGHECFPLDVWIRREIQRLYFGGDPAPMREIQAFARRRFGSTAGYSQLYLYHHARQRSE